MTKKHFEAFAKAVKNYSSNDEYRQIAADVVITVAKQFNERFDKEKFLKACGLLSNT